MKDISINHATLDQFYDGSAEAMEEVFTEFLLNQDNIKEGLQSPMFLQPSAELKKFLHFHGPSFMYAGLPEISKQFKLLENNCAMQDLNPAEFEEEIKSLRQMVDTATALVTAELLRIKQKAA